ncbi:MAG TPA: glycosyltransferase family 2 protein [Chloroflexia bacterium]|nr:glycosyltransferase family 2 protein [Chloroflexia bacterium]
MSAAPPPSLSIIIMAIDEAEHLEGCISSAAGLLARRHSELVIILDGRATPAVEAVARQHTSQVHRLPFVNFSAQRNNGLARAGGEWVLFLDPDERVTPALAREIAATMAAPVALAGYWVPRRTLMFGHEVRHAGWWPDYQMRFLRRAVAHYDEARAVHEVPQVPAAQQGHLHEPLIHYNYATWRQFTAKQRQYAVHEAQAQFAQGARARPRNFVLQPLREFRRRYWTLEGWKDGLLGLVLALAMAYYTLRMYGTLARLPSAGQGGPPADTLGNGKGL